MKVYAIREDWPYEIYDLIDFFASREDADIRVAELNAKKERFYAPYEVEEIEVK